MAVATNTKQTNSPAALVVHARPNFIETPGIQELKDRSLAYLQAGYPVHFRGPSGTGKTTLALHVAAQLRQPVIFIAGDDEFSTSDLVGGQIGYRLNKVLDRYIHSVAKYEESASKQWADNRLTTACREGYTLVYDEFTRSRPEANNILLSVLEERLLIFSGVSQKEAYLKVHPDFRAIFTSNPQEYAGVHDTQDALGDRLVTLDLDYYDRETEIKITSARSNLHPEKVAKIVDIVRDFRASGEYDHVPTMRACIIISRVAFQQKMHIKLDDPHFVNLCLDILGSKTSYTSESRDRRVQQRKMLLSLIEHYIG